ncbi:MAG: Hint domain-containing protein, partial [Tateyamaria sp.]
TFIEIGPGDTIVGGEGGDDFDTIVVSSTSVVEFDPNDPEAGVVTFYDFGSITPTGTATFSQIENVIFVEDNPNPAPPSDAPDSEDDDFDVVPVIPTSVSIPSVPVPGPGVVEGTNGPDSIGPGYVDADGDEVDGPDGLDDTILAFDGNDTVDAGLGDDEVLAGGGNDRVLGGEGNDVLRGEDGDDTIRGGIGNDQLAGDEGDDQLFGGEGNDILEGGDGTNVLEGGAGNDFIIGGDEGELVVGGDDSDFIVGGKGDDLIFVGDTNQVDDGAADIVFAGDDADQIFGGGAGDTIIGGEGGNDDDTLNLTGSGPLTINFDGGDPNSESGTVDFLDDDGNVTGTLTFAEIENVIPCFTPGTKIATASGERLVQDLQVGDRVITRDNGIQEIRWVGQRDMSGGELARAAHLRPVLIRQGALGNGLPERDMLVSPQHRVLMSSDKTALYFEESEVLVPAKHLTDMEGIDVVDVSHTTYIHVMFDQHEVILSDGTWTESFQPGDQTLNAMDDTVRAEILELFPELETETGIRAYAAARRSLKKHEAKLLTQ